MRIETARRLADSVLRRLERPETVSVPMTPDQRDLSVLQAVTRAILEAGLAPTAIRIASLGLPPLGTRLFDIDARETYAAYLANMLPDPEGPPTSDAHRADSLTSVPKLPDPPTSNRPG